MKKLLLQSFLCLLLVTWLPSIAYSWSLFGWLYKLDMNVKLDRNTREQVDQMIEQAKSLESLLNDLPHDMRRQLEPLIEKASLEMEHVVNSMGTTMLNVAEKTLSDVERITQKTLDRVEGLMNNGIEQYKLASQEIIKQAGKEINNAILSFETVASHTIEKAEQALQRSIIHGGQVLDNFNVGIRGNIQYSEQAAARLIERATTDTERILYTGLANLYSIINSQREGLAGDAALTLDDLNTYSEARLEQVDAIVGSLTSTLQQLPLDLEQTGLSIANNASKKGIEVIDYGYSKYLDGLKTTHDSASDVIDQAQRAADKTLASLFKSIAKLLSLSVLLFLGFQILNRAINDESNFSFTQGRAAALASIALVCLFLTFSDFPFSMVFTPSGESTTHPTTKGFPDMFPLDSTILLVEH